ncbi:MAG: hypothetical protein IJH14_08930 [Solobacterium sp.]|nr:hypothetical protein [Solobacterium sp.]
MKKTLSYILMIIGGAALLFGLFLMFNGIRAEQDVRKRAEDALETMINILPERTAGLLYEEDSEPMGSVEINGLNLVGYVEIGDVCAFAVQNEAGNEAAAKMKEGLIRAGTGVITADTVDIKKIMLEMPVVFTDVSGTQYHFVIDYIGDSKVSLQNEQLVILAEGMTNETVIACRAE